MSLTAAELETIVRSATPGLSSAAQVELRRMLAALCELEFHSTRGTTLRKLCSAGVDYGWNQLIELIDADLLARTSPKAHASLRRHLQSKLEWITRPSLELEWKSFVLALHSLGLSLGSEQRAKEQMFLRDRPSHRLFAMFQKFPVLAQLWSLAIYSWQRQVIEVLERSVTDRSAIARSFFHKVPAGRIKNIRLGLSDPHDRGRSVTLVEFEDGRVIYKPRSGASESAWFELLAWMSHHGFRPGLRGARVLQRKNYYWMEYVEATTCRNEAAVRRFYTRLGGMVAVAYLLKAVDCHRENVIAAGEYPVLVDIDALWHVSPLTKTQSLATVLYRTGFFPSTQPRSLQSRSSVLGWATTGKHLPRIAGRPVSAKDYAKELTAGFSRAWDCLVGTSGRRSFFLKKLREIQRQPRRWIYLATEKYAAILRASINPPALESDKVRKEHITRLCSRSSVKPALIRAEIRALLRLDLPYFVRQTDELMPADKGAVPSELLEAIQKPLSSASSRSLRQR
jgi:lantibiotic modifying enzyme